VAFSQAEGLYGDEAPRIYRQLILPRGLSGFGGGGLGGFGSFGGGMGGLGGRGGVGLGGGIRGY
jgi:hypothetical protein